MARALLIVDVQNDFLPGGALAVKEGDEVIPVINLLLENFDIVLATKDWHPKDHISFASHHKRKPYEVVEVKGRRQELWPDHCIQGSKGAEFSKELDTHKIRKIFYKGIDQGVDSYSAFFDNAHLRSTGLAGYLNEHGIDEIFIVGLATDYCVKYSVEDAVKLGKKITVVIDACRGVEVKPGDIDRAIAEMEQLGAQIVTSQEIKPDE